MRTFLSRLVACFRKRQREADLHHELQSHLDLLADDYIRHGLSRVEARAAARRDLGGVEQVKEQYRDQRGWPLLDALAQDVRYALRLLTKNRGFAAVTILTLTLGIGANTALFSVVYGVLLRPLPYRDDRRLVMIEAERDYVGTGRPGQVLFALPNLNDWQRGSHVFESLAMASWTTYARSTLDETEPLSTAIVSDGFFDTLAARFDAGRGFDTGDRGAPVAVISERLWNRAFDHAPTVIGQALVLNRQSYVIVGVIPPGLRIPVDNIDAWIPASFQATLQPDVAGSGRARYGYELVGRLKSDITMGQAQADADNVSAMLRREHPDTYEGRRVQVIALRDKLFGTMRAPLTILFAAVGLVLVTACANVGNLMLARNTARAQEIGVRLALGASRGRLLGQSLVESAMIASAGALTAMLLAYGLVTWLVRSELLPDLDARTVRIDVPVMLFTVGATALTTVVTGLLPAFQMSDIAHALKTGAQTMTAGRRQRWMRATLVVAQVAVSMVLLVGASLFVRSLNRLLHTDLGFATDHVMTAQVDLSLGRATSVDRQRSMTDDLLARFSALPGAQAVGVASGRPPNLSRLRFTMNSRDATTGRSVDYAVTAITATPGFFPATGIALLNGRLFSPSDTASSAQVMLMSAKAATLFFGHDDPIGRTMELPLLGGGHADVPIVGIVADVKFGGLEASSDPVIYRPFSQQPWRALTIFIRTLGDIAPSDSGMRRVIAAVDPAIAVADVRPLGSVVLAAAAQPRFRTLSLTALATLALALAVIGLYGVMTYSVSRRTHEFGIRLALGATTRNITGLVLREGLSLATSGIVIGLLGAAVLTRVVASLLFDVRVQDSVSFAGAALVLLSVALVASVLPARRAVRIDPLATLRQE